MAVVEGDFGYPQEEYVTPHVPEAVYNRSVERMRDSEKRLDEDETDNAIQVALNLRFPSVSPTPLSESFFTPPDLIPSNVAPTTEPVPLLAGIFGEDEPREYGLFGMIQGFDLRAMRPVVLEQKDGKIRMVDKSVERRVVSADVVASSGGLPSTMFSAPVFQPPSSESASTQDVSKAALRHLGEQFDARSGSGVSAPVAVSSVGLPSTMFSAPILQSPSSEASKQAGSSAPAVDNHFSTPQSSSTQPLSGFMIGQQTGFPAPVVDKTSSAQPMYTPVTGETPEQVSSRLRQMGLTDVWMAGDYLEIGGRVYPKSIYGYYVDPLTHKPVDPDELYRSLAEHPTQEMERNIVKRWQEAGQHLVDGKMVLPGGELYSVEGGHLKYAGRLPGPEAGPVDIVRFDYPTGSIESAMITPSSPVFMGQPLSEKAVGLPVVTGAGRPLANIWYDPVQHRFESVYGEGVEAAGDVLYGVGADYYWPRGTDYLTPEGQMIRGQGVPIHPVVTSVISDAMLVSSSKTSSSESSQSSLSESSKTSSSESSQSSLSESSKTSSSESSQRSEPGVLSAGFPIGLRGMQAESTVLKYLADGFVQGLKLGWGRGEASESLDSRLKTAQKESEEIAAQAERLKPEVEKWNADVADLQARGKELEAAYDDYNKRVAAINAMGGADEKTYEALRKEAEMLDARRSQLELEYASLQARQSTLSPMVESYQSSVQEFDKRYGIVRDDQGRIVSSALGDEAKNVENIYGLSDKTRAIADVMYTGYTGIGPIDMLRIPSVSRLYNLIGGDPMARINEFFGKGVLGQAASVPFAFVLGPFSTIAYAEKAIPTAMATMIQQPEKLPVLAGGAIGETGRGMYDRPVQTAGVVILGEALSGFPIARTAGGIAKRIAWENPIEDVRMQALTGTTRTGEVLTPTGGLSDYFVNYHPVVRGLYEDATYGPLLRSGLYEADIRVEGAARPYGQPEYATAPYSGTIGNILNRFGVRKTTGVVPESEGVTTVRVGPSSRYFETVRLEEPIPYVEAVPTTPPSEPPDVYLRAWGNVPTYGSMEGAPTMVTREVYFPKPGVDITRILAEKGGEPTFMSRARTSASRILEDVSSVGRSVADYYMKGWGLRGESLTESSYSPWGIEIERGVYDYSRLRPSQPSSIREQALGAILDRYLYSRGVKDILAVAKPPRARTVLAEEVEVAPAAELRLVKTKVPRMSPAYEFDVNGFSVMGLLSVFRPADARTVSMFDNIVDTFGLTGLHRLSFIHSLYLQDLLQGQKFDLLQGQKFDLLQGQKFDLSQSQKLDFYRARGFATVSGEPVGGGLSGWGLWLPWMPSGSVSRGPGSSYSTRTWVYTNPIETFYPFRVYRLPPVASGRSGRAKLGWFRMIYGAEPPPSQRPMLFDVKPATITQERVDLSLEKKQNKMTSRSIGENPPTYENGRMATKRGRSKRSYTSLADRPSTSDDGRPHRASGAIITDRPIVDSDRAVVDTRMIGAPTDGINNAIRWARENAGVEPSEVIVHPEYQTGIVGGRRVQVGDSRARLANWLELHRKNASRFAPGREREYSAILGMAADELRRGSTPTWVNDVLPKPEHSELYYDNIYEGEMMHELGHIWYDEHARTIKRRLGASRRTVARYSPTRKGEESMKEAMAESFSLYAIGRADLLHPKVARLLSTGTMYSKRRPMRLSRPPSHRLRSMLAESKTPYTVEGYRGNEVVARVREHDSAVNSRLGSIASGIGSKPIKKRRGFI